MPRTRISPIYRRHLPDLIAGLLVFAIMVALMGLHPSNAMAAPATVAGSLDNNATAVLLAGAFSAMAVFNVAFFRHLCRAYVAPRRAAARRALRSGRSDLT